MRGGDKGRIGGGNRIVGSDEPFEALRKLERGATTSEGFSEYREGLKAILAKRMLCVKTKPVHFSKLVFSIVKQMLADESVNSFFGCTTQYYIGRNTHNIKLNTECSSCSSLDPYKSVRHALQDSLLLSGRDFLCKVQKSLPSNIDADTLDDIRAAKSGVDFFANYIYCMLVGCLPRALSVSQYNLIESCSKQLHWNNQTSLYYILDEENNIYTKIKGKIFYSRLNLETATAIFCCHYLKK